MLGGYPWGACPVLKGIGGVDLWGKGDEGKRFGGEKGGCNILKKNIFKVKVVSLTNYQYSWERQGGRVTTQGFYKS